MTSETELFIVSGLERSGTIWLTRLLADALQVGSRSRRRNPPFTSKDDPAVSRIECDRFIRRLHYYSDNKEYLSPHVLIVRDPRDTAISQSFYYGSDPNIQARWLAGGAKPSRWERFYMGWMQDPRFVSCVRYTDLLSNTAGELDGLIDSLVNRGVDIERPSMDDIEQAVHKNEFSRMDNPLKRKGIVGDWKNYLNARTTTVISKASSDGMRYFGYD